MDNQQAGGNFVGGPEVNQALRQTQAEFFGAEKPAKAENLTQIRQELGGAVNTPELFEANKKVEQAGTEVMSGFNIGEDLLQFAKEQEAMTEAPNADALRSLTVDGSTEGIRGADLNRDVMNKKDYLEDRKEADEVLKSGGLFALKNWDTMKMKKTLKNSWNRDFPRNEVA